MKRFFVLCALVSLSACSGLSKTEFLEDIDNQTQYETLETKFVLPKECEILMIDNVSESDIEKTLSYVGIAKKDIYNLEKISKLNFDDFDKNCKEYEKLILKERENNKKWCADKYYDETIAETVIYFPYRLVAGVSVFTFIGAIPFVLIAPEKCTDMKDKLWHPATCANVVNCTQYLNEKLEKQQVYSTISGKINDFYRNYEINKNNKISAENKAYLAKLKFCKTDFPKGCLDDIDGTVVADFGVRDNGVIVTLPGLLGGFVKLLSGYNGEYFVYGSNDYFDSQKFNAGGYYYEYVGNYNTGISSIPAFRRSKHKIFTKKETYYFSDQYRDYKN